jgi:hypothetical protein
MSKMAEPKFSPGPWYAPHLSTARENSSCRCQSICEERYAGGIATVHINNGIPLVSDGGNDAPPEEEAKANGFLISAAPDLYASLDELFDYHGGAANALEDEYVVDRANAALAKARGET